MPFFLHQHGTVEVVTIPAPDLLDNYLFVLITKKVVVAIDPAKPSAVEKLLKTRKLELDYIINTHGDFDHVGGNMELKQKYDCTIIGPDDRRITGLDKPVYDTDTIELNDLAFEVIATPGHTTCCTSFYLPDAGIVFSGDCLLAAGCGRVKECTPDTMYASLQRLAALPPDTTVYSAHNYTEENLRFAAQYDTHNKQLDDRIEATSKLVARGEPTVPSTIEEELATNIFLRSGESDIASALGMEGAAPKEVFAELRHRKNSF